MYQVAEVDIKLCLLCGFYSGFEQAKQEYGNNNGKVNQSPIEPGKEAVNGKESDYSVGESSRQGIEKIFFGTEVFEIFHGRPPCCWRHYMPDDTQKGLLFRRPFACNCYIVLQEKGLEPS